MHSYDEWYCCASYFHPISISVLHAASSTLASVLRRGACFIVSTRLVVAGRAHACNLSFDPLSAVPLRELSSTLATPRVKISCLDTLPYPDIQITTPVSEVPHSIPASPRRHGRPAPPPALPKSKASFSPLISRAHARTIKSQYICSAGAPLDLQIHRPGASDRLRSIAIAPPELRFRATGDGRGGLESTRVARSNCLARVIVRSSVFAVRGEDMSDHRWTVEAHGRWSKLTTYCAFPTR
ncbi:hypothetical protein OH77DRAFT_523320 [Trametes cingulata]|nr:hypothetical protein OH77DRAFT_523320 [Trametes cingulata]